MNDLCMLCIIINSQLERKINKFLKKYNLGFKYVLHARGTASSSILDYFELDNEDKVIITTILPNIIGKNILTEINNKINIKNPGMGIGFTIALSSSTKYMLDYYQERKMEDIDMDKVSKHLIITITNQGYADSVMDEAKKNGATGGTILNGRGLDSEKLIKFFNIQIEPEKDIIWILASSDKKTAIMDGILKKCGLKTPGAGICFSLPVDYAVGMQE